jgi:hypothetical protein
VVRAPDCQIQTCTSPWFNSSILRHSGIREAADDVVLNKVLKKPPLKASLPTLQRQNAENFKQIFPEKEYSGLSPIFHIHVSVSELYISTMGLPFLLEEICVPMLETYKSLTNTCGNVEIGAEAALFPEKEYIRGIAVAVYAINLYHGVWYIST